MQIEQFPEFVRRNVEVEIPLPGVRGWLLQGSAQQAVFVEFHETVDVPEHAHADQWEIVVAGRVELQRNGGSELFEAGDNFFVPAGQPHAAKVYSGYKAVIIFDEPDRYQARPPQIDQGAK